jgi:hypothetical protein
VRVCAESRGARVSHMCTHMCYGEQVFCDGASSRTERFSEIQGRVSNAHMKLLTKQMAEPEEQPTASVEDTADKSEAAAESEPAAKRIKTGDEASKDAADTAATGAP